jgi:hypothetical protein
LIVAAPRGCGAAASSGRVLKIFAILPDLWPRFSGAFFSADALCVAAGRAMRRHRPSNKWRVPVK